MKMRCAAMAIAFLFLGAITQAHAVTFAVTGTNLSGDTLSGSIEADAALTTVTAVNLFVSGPGFVADGPLDGVGNYSNPILAAGGPVWTNALIYLSYSGGPTPSEINALIFTDFDPASCAGNTICFDLISGQRSVVFSAVATPAVVPLPAALPLFATILAGGGLIAWRRRRRAANIQAL